MVAASGPAYRLFGTVRRRNGYNQASAMRCWSCLSIVLLLSACKQGAAPPVFPASVSDAWRLKSSQNFPAGSAPELVRKIGTRGWWRAGYEGPGSATVEVYELTAPPRGLEMVQRWQPAADTVVWYTPRYFVVVKWQSADRAAVGALIRSLEKQFQEQK
jgi:hypothetical protein